MTIIHEANGYVGGYLVTNTWGRPLEFRLSTAVRPSRIQQILYGDALEPYVFADLIGKALIDRTATRVQLLLTDKRPLLELRRLVETPIVCVVSESQTNSRGRDRPNAQMAAPQGDGLLFHAGFANDKLAFEQVQAGLDAGLDLTEPFARVRDAICEARKAEAPVRG